MSSTFFVMVTANLYNLNAFTYQALVCNLIYAGGRRDLFGSSHDASGGNAVPARPNLDRIRHEATDSGRGRHIPVKRQPFSPEEGFNEPFVGRHFDDHYFYDDSSHGIKQPFFMTVSWTSFKFLFFLKYYCFEISVSVAHNVTCLSVFFFWH
ncbi:hypothetical protein ACSBR2_027723 [Camellia fascicularis]